MKLCECGCGELAPMAKSDNRRLGHVKGRPVRFVSGHNQRGKPKSAETRRRMSEYHCNRTPEHHARLLEAARRREPTATDPSTIHAWLSRRYPKKGICEECGTVSASSTDYAFQRHPEPYTHDRKDYAELCRRCHMLSDGRLERLRNHEWRAA